MPPETRSKASKVAATAEPGNLRKWRRTIDQHTYYANPSWAEFWKDDDENNRQEWMTNKRDSLLQFLEEMRAEAQHVPTSELKRTYEAALKTEWENNWERLTDPDTGEIYDMTTRRRMGRGMAAAYNASFQGYRRHEAGVAHEQYRVAQGLWEGKACSYTI